MKNYENIASIIGLKMLTGNAGKPALAKDLRASEAYVRPYPEAGPP